jgi:NADH:ubiquinone oxidoreductase subunit F (NADH-binding)
VARDIGVPEAEVYGTASFFHLLRDPDVTLRVCTGLSCLLKGSAILLQRAIDLGLPVGECACLAACDQAPAVLSGREVLAQVAVHDIDGTRKGPLMSKAQPDIDWRGHVGPEGDDDSMAMNLCAAPDYSGAAFRRAQELGAEAVLDAVESSGLQGRGGAGFPAAIKWRAVREQPNQPHYVVLNADEGEPGTFKDRDVLLNRPDRVLEGLAIAANALGATQVYLYLRGEFRGPWRALEQALEKFSETGGLGDVQFHLHAGHGAYICGEETALLEALEGKRGMPRLKPPFPTDNGLWGKPTLIQNVETIACVPAIVMRGGDWFKALGRSEPGTKLYSISGHVARPGTYELPLGVTLDELVDAAGGYLGELRAFSPGGASSGFLPASFRTTPLDFGSLAKVGSMLGSAGVVVLNRDADLLWAAREQLRFFEIESCGQCAPCRIGTRFQRQALDRVCQRRTEKSAELGAELERIADVAWEMNEGSICGLGQAASLPLTSVLKHFPEEFADDD